MKTDAGADNLLNKVQMTNKCENHVRNMNWEYVNTIEDTDYTQHYDAHDNNRQPKAAEETLKNYNLK